MGTINYLASFVEPKALYMFTGKQKSSFAYDKSDKESDEKLISNFCEDEMLLQIDTYPRERMDMMSENEVMLLVTGSRNLMLDLSRICYVYCAKCLTDTYCLDSFTDARDIVNRRILQENIYQQACKFILIGNIKKIIEFAKENYLNLFNGLKEHVEK